MRSRRQEVPVSEAIDRGMSKADIVEAQELEKLLTYQDKVMEQTKYKKNALEAYVYEVRNKLFESYRSYATEKEKEDISGILQQTEEWLYEDGVDETEKVYTAKLDELTKLVDPIENRYKDVEARAQAARGLLNRIAEHRIAAKSLIGSEHDEIINECNKAEQWLKEKSQLQDELPKNVDPILWSHEISRATEALDINCRDILRRSKDSPSRPEDERASDQSR